MGVPCCEGDHLQLGPLHMVKSVSEFFSQVFLGSYSLYFRVRVRLWEISDLSCSQLSV